jgi:hypothetical protein
MPEAIYRGRRAVAIENSAIRVTVLEEGGHIAEVFHKDAGINPLWTPKWPSIEPSAFERAPAGAYGDDVDGKLLAGIMGHNLCLDIFGGPSQEEAAAGLTPHGEASVTRYETSSAQGVLICRATFTMAELRFERRIEIVDSDLRIGESLENLSACDRPIGWTQHVTLGAPFLERGKTEFRASVTRSKVFESRFGSDDYLVPAAEFDWPAGPRLGGGFADMRLMNAADASSGYTTHLTDPESEHAFFVGFSPAHRLAFGYVWSRTDFPWLGIWEENHSRQQAPWLGRELTRGMEFGVSPFPETRRQMVERGRLFDTPTFRWIPGKSRLAVEYWIVSRRAEAILERLEWPG